MLEVLLLVTIAVAIGFDFTNGFHDTANAIATSVSTRALSPRMAVLVSAVFNLVGALVTVNLFHAKVSNTIASTVHIHVSLVLILAALLGAIGWNLITWYLGLPSSSTHALIGGLVGAAIADAGSFGGVGWATFLKQILSLVISPPIGFVVAAIFMTLLLLAVHGFRPAPLNRSFRLVQMLTAAFVSFSHGGNDAQKTMAAMSMALLAAGQLHKFTVPDWVVLVSALTIGIGTYAGGWRIIRTLGWRIYKLDPATGLSAQLMAATVIQVASAYGLPVSTTHVVTGSVIGAGAARKLSAPAWGVGANIIAAWILTIPAAAAMAWVMYAILHTARIG